jgi:hypothetical protein
LSYHSPSFPKILFPIAGITAFLAFLIWGIFAFGSRGGRNVKGFPCVQSAEQNNVGENQNKINLIVHVGIDGSGSMLGFVRGGTSQYITIIQKLDDLLRPSNLKTDLGSKVEDVKVNFFRLGVSEPSQITERKLLGKDDTSFLDAKFPRFYCYGQPKMYPCVTSSLHQVFTNQAAASETIALIAPPAMLSNTKNSETSETPSTEIRIDTMQILITDLEPDNAAIGEITNHISNILIQKPDYKAILLGIPSEFNGILYSADRPDLNNKPYQSRRKPEQDGRPFYLFLIGPTAVVETFVERFLDRVGRDIAKTIKASAFNRQNSPILLNVNDSFDEFEKDCIRRRFNLRGKRLTPKQESEWLILEQRQCQDKYNDIELEKVHSQPSWLLRRGKFVADLFASSHPSIVNVKGVSLDSEADPPRLDLSLRFTGKKSNSDEQPIYITLKEKDLDEIIWQEWSAPINILEGTKTQQLMDFVKSVRGKVSQDQDALRFCLGYVKT